MADTRYWEPCEQCRKPGLHLLVPYCNPAGSMILGIVCDECLALQPRKGLAERERRHLAEWGTVAERRAS